MTGFIQDLHTVSQDITRDMHAEAVTLYDGTGVISVEISDAVVSLDTPSITRDDGPAEYTAVIRLAATHHATAVTSQTALVRGQTWDIVSVGDVYAGAFRVELSRLDANHTNRFDLSQQQGEWL